MFDVRRKIEEGQTYIEVNRVSSRPPRGNFPRGGRSRMIIIRLTVDDWPLCYAHHYVNADGSNFTGPDPKWIQIDDVIFKQGSRT